MVLCWHCLVLIKKRTLLKQYRVISMQTGLKIELDDLRKNLLKKIDPLSHLFSHYPGTRTTAGDWNNDRLVNPGPPSFRIRSLQTTPVWFRVHIAADSALAVSLLTLGFTGRFVSLVTNAGHLLCSLAGYVRGRRSTNINCLFTN